MPRHRGTLPIAEPDPAAASGRQVAARLHHYFEATTDRVPERVAVQDGDWQVSYRALDQWANMLAHHLRSHGIAEGARVGILLERSVLTYVSLLAVLKAGAAFVPIDPEAPGERVGYIASDADLALLLTSTELARAAEVDLPLVTLDSLADLPEAPIGRPDGGTEGDPPAYVIYTSGSSGRPKGVEVAHSSISNFIDVIPGVYDVRQDDRVYQGMSISFDFSLEEIWPTWAVGASLVAGPTDSRRVGEELAEFLDKARISVLFCVPTLLATIPDELPRVRTLIVGGEACPAELVERWSTSGRRMLNTYGPTEATVTATWCELEPGRAVTIGTPVPTYTVTLLDEHLDAVADGEIGEVCIGGPGVANGYLNMPEKTAERFVAHPQAPDGGQLYRTGDLGRVHSSGEIEYLGRADAEVKIRGQRVDLGEIESLLLEDPGVAAAAVDLIAGSAGAGELAAYVTAREPDTDDAALAERVREQSSRRLPRYMVPASLDVLGELPTMPSGKVDRSRLPTPAGARLAQASGPVVEPASDVEEQIAKVWAEVFGLDVTELSVEADFFDDLGGHSLLAATTISRLRATVSSTVAVRELYAHPTVRSLSEHLDPAVDSAAPESEAPKPAPRPEPVRHLGGRVGQAGTVQLAFLYLLLALGTLPVAVVYSSYDGAVLVTEAVVWLAVAVLASYLISRWLLPPLLVRALAAGIRPGRYPLWGMTHARLWALDTVLGFAPLPVLSGSPALAGYLRLLGARVGRRTHIATSAISVPSLLSLGDDAALGYGAGLHPWQVQDGWVLVGEVSVGDGAFVGAGTQLEAGAQVGESATLGEHSSVGRDQTIPAGASWTGSPAAPADAPDPGVHAMAERPSPPDWSRRGLAGIGAGVLLLETVMLGILVPSIVLVWVSLLTWGTGAGIAAAALVGPVFVLTATAAVAVLRRAVLPRFPSGLHPARSGLGVRKWIADKLFEMSLTYTNSLYATLYAVPWLRMLGARIGSGAEVSTVSYAEPEMLRLGEGSFVADMATVGSARFHNGYVDGTPTEVGRRAFIGNAAVLPPGTDTGDGSLIGVQTVPPAGEVPAETSWLGSPAMHLPQRQDSGDFTEEQTFRPGRGKLAARLGIEFFRVTAPASLLALAVYLALVALSGVAAATGAVATVLIAPLLFLAGGLGVFGAVVGLKWALVGRYRPRVEPLWSGFVRRSELVTGLYEAAAVPALLGVLAGTPLLPPTLRALGARIGRRCWIATTYLTEFDLVTVGDDAAIGRRVSLQTHLFEDRVMKMSTLRVEAQATVGDRSIVLYDAELGAGAALEPLSLAMKGEHLPANTRWRGIPAQGVSS